MWRSKKLIIAAVLAAVILAGSIGGLVLAADNGEDSQPEAKCGALLDRVCEIYQEKTGVAIDQEVLKDAFAQAQSEMRTQALQNRLQNLVNEGRITQSEADQCLEWWQARPDMEPFWQQLREWEQARPDAPVRFGLKGGGGFPGMRGMHGFGGLCVPWND